ncbi:MAG: hypothetical protein ACOVQS_07160 [Chitinophagaceae bacterium]
MLLPSLSGEINDSWDIDLTIHSIFAKDPASFSLSGAALYLRLKRSF